jgi:guanylate kinase
MNKEHTLLCILGESSCGKDSLTNKLCEAMGYSAICSYTTRPKRDGEGETHLFVDDAIYEEMLAADKIAAYTEISNYRYWTTTDQLHENDIYIIDPLGLETLKNLQIPNLKLVSVYINVPESERKLRAQKRGDNMSVYRARAISERDQFRDMKKNMTVDYVIPNTDFNKAFCILKRIATIEGLSLNQKEDEEYGR